MGFHINFNDYQCKKQYQPSTTIMNILYQLKPHKHENYSNV